jgi:hypothetical protein
MTEVLASHGTNAKQDHGPYDQVQKMDVASISRILFGTALDLAVHFVAAISSLVVAS